MFQWFRNLFKKRPVIGYKVFVEADGDREQLGPYYCSAEEALELAKMEVMQRFFLEANASKGLGVLISNYEAVPIYGEAK